MGKKKSKTVFLILKSISGILVLSFFLHIFLFTSSIVQGSSMFPVLEEGDRVVFNKAAYIFEEPQRGDIVIIQRPLKNYVKRIIALPGETIEVKNSRLFINGERYSQPFLTEEEIEQTTDFGPVTIPQDSYFVMGDNRLISKDSRNGLGLVTKNEIIGRSEMVIYPLNEFSITR